MIYVKPLGLLMLKAGIIRQSITMVILMSNLTMQVV